MGYSSKDKKPFEEIGLIPNAETEVNMFLDRPEHHTYKETVEKTKKFLAGFYSYFSLELLSTIDFITLEKQDYSIDVIKEELKNWSNRKQTLFTNPNFIQIAVDNLRKNLA